MGTTRSSRIRSIRPADRSCDVAPRGRVLGAALVLAAEVAVTALEATAPAPRGSGTAPIPTLTHAWPKVSGPGIGIVSGEVFVKLPAGAGR